MSTVKIKNRRTGVSFEVPADSPAANRALSNPDEFEIKSGKSKIVDPFVASDQVFDDEE